MITNINKLTLKQYAEFKAVLSEPTQTSEDELDKDFKLLSIVTGKPVDYFENLPGNKLKTYLIKLGLLLNTSESRKIKRTIWVNGKRYKATKNDDYLSNNQYTYLKTFEVEFDKNIHHLAAILYLPCPLFKSPKFDDKNFFQIIRDFEEHATVGQVYGTLFFYSVRFEKRKESLLLSSLNAQITIAERMTEVFKGLRELGVNTDGITS